MLLYRKFCFKNIPIGQVPTATLNITTYKRINRTINVGIVLAKLTLLIYKRGNSLYHKKPLLLQQMYLILIKYSFEQLS